MSSTVDVPPFSVPRYLSGQPEQQSKRRLLVTQEQGCERVSQGDDSCQVSHLALPDFQSLDALRLALAEQLRTAEVGLLVELQGDEAFIWALRGVARDAGLLAGEIILTCTGQGRRQLFCVHCASLQTGSAAEVQPCQHCGVMLEVRRHFSERLGAYLGVCVDADQPYAESRP